MTRQQLLTAACLDPVRFPTPSSCTSCGRPFGAEVISRRVYDLKIGFVLAALCEPCESEIPRGSPAEAVFTTHLAHMMLESLPAHGRA